MRIEYYCFSDTFKPYPIRNQLRVMQHIYVGINGKCSFEDMPCALKNPSEPTLRTTNIQNLNTIARSITVGVCNDERYVMASLDHAATLFYKNSGIVTRMG